MIYKIFEIENEMDNTLLGQGSRGRIIESEMSQYFCGMYRRWPSLMFLIAQIFQNPRFANQIRAEEICSSGICSVFSDQDLDVHTD